MVTIYKEQNPAHNTGVSLGTEPSDETTALDGTWIPMHQLHCIRFDPQTL